MVCPVRLTPDLYVDILSWKPLVNYRTLQGCAQHIIA